VQQFAQDFTSKIHIFLQNVLQSYASNIYRHLFETFHYPTRHRGCFRHCGCFHHPRYWPTLSEPSSIVLESSSIGSEPCTNRLGAEIEWLGAELHSLGTVLLRLRAELDRLRAELDRLRAELLKLGAELLRLGASSVGSEPSSLSSEPSSLGSEPAP
jgi:hypothetical protein